MAIICSSENRVTLLSESITLTNSWQALGDRVNTKGLLNTAIWVKGLKNDSDSLRIRCRCFFEENGTESFVAQIQTIGSNLVSLRAEEYETSEPVIALVTPLGFSALVPYIQLEAKVNMEGATPAVIEKALISFDRK